MGRKKLVAETPTPGAEMARIRAELADLKNATESLRQSNEIYELLLKNIPALVVMSNAKGEATYFSPTVEALTGFKSEEIKGHRFSEFILPEDLPLVEGSFEKALTGPHEPIECRVKARSGEIRHVRVYRQRMTQAGQPVVVSTVTDITDRKHAERELARYREELEILVHERTTELQHADRILKTAGFAAALFLKETELHRSIPRVLKQLGKVTEASRVYLFENHRGSDGSLLTSQRYEWVAQGVSAEIDNPILQNMSYVASGFGRWIGALQKGKPINALVESLPASERPILETERIKAIIIVPVFLGNRWWGFLGFDDCEKRRLWSESEKEGLRVVADVLGAALWRDRIEQSLRESETNFKALAENVTDGILIAWESGHVCYANRQIVEMTGYSLEELLAMEWQDLTRPEEVDDISTRYKTKSKERSSLVQYETFIRRKDGGWIPIEVSSGTTIWQGKPAGVATLHDITRRKKIDAEQQKRLELEALILRVSTRFLGLSPSEVDTAVTEALGELSRFVSADKCVLYEKRMDPKVFHLTHEWIAPDITTGVKSSASISADEFPSLFIWVFSKEVVRIDSLDELPEDALKEKEYCIRAGYFSIMNLPLFRGKEIIGYLGFRAMKKPKKWTDDEMRAMQIFADIIANTLLRRRLEEERQRLAGSLLEVQENERKMISATLHDHLGQLLTLSRMELGSIKPKDVASEKSLKKATERLDDSLASVRDLARSLRPPILDDLGIKAAFETMVDEFSASSGINAQLETKGRISRLDKAKEIALYRVLQEALTNVARHAKASRVNVVLKAGPKDICLKVCDDGVGIQAQKSIKAGIGLIGLRERMRQCGGNVDIQSISGRGMTVIATVPKGARPRRKSLD